MSVTIGVAASVVALVFVFISIVITVNALKARDAAIKLWEKQLKVSKGDTARLRRLYNDLIMEVVVKHSGESRHETALRHIRQAEVANNNCESCASANDKGCR